MTRSRDNHYVPCWHQKGFIETGKNSLAYLDLNPSVKTLEDGRTINARSLFQSAPVSRCFYQTDLYSTFFLTNVDDEIEKKLFGEIDSRGAIAVRAFCKDNKTEWIRNFQTLFEYLDIQKIRTPKGLDWLRKKYPRINQNDLMQEMQGIRMMHCSIWSEGVREIVSAEKSSVKFIVSDHPVTVYNHGIPLNDKRISYPFDPSITLKGTQTIFPLNRDFCLILTNLEYAKEAGSDPTSKRTFPRHFKDSMVKADEFIRTRNLRNDEVMEVNYIIKSRAKRFIAAGKVDWLYPEEHISKPWTELRDVLRPPENGLLFFGGEMYAKYKSGHVHYQDAYGRTEEEREFLKKAPRVKPLHPNDYCGCGYGKRYKDCCQSKDIILRPSWNELSIRERNLRLLSGIANILELDDTKDWVAVRKELTNENISKIYGLFDALWPRETDIFSLLPKPDGKPRAVYTGILHPEFIAEFALGASVYFGEVTIQHPFIHPGYMKDEFNPVKNPQNFRLEFLKSVLFFITVMPLVDMGIVNLVPDPCYFDRHLQRQTMAMAEDRNRHLDLSIADDPRAKKLMENFLKLSNLLMPNSVLLDKISKVDGEITEERRDLALESIQKMKEKNLLVDLNEEGFTRESGGQMNLLQMAPNFEMAMYIAQAIGGSIITDSPQRWKEFQLAAAYSRPTASEMIDTLRAEIQNSSFAFPQVPTDCLQLVTQADVVRYQNIIGRAFNYLRAVSEKGRKPNFEAGLAAQFKQSHGKVQKLINGNDLITRDGKMECLFPAGGVQHHTVNRLLLMSASEHYMQNVPMVFYLHP